MRFVDQAKVAWVIVWCWRQGGGVGARVVGVVGAKAERSRAPCLSPSLQFFAFLNAPDRPGFGWLVKVTAQKSDSVFKKFRKSSTSHKATSGPSRTSSMLVRSLWRPAMPPSAPPGTRNSLRCTGKGGVVRDAFLLSEDADSALALAATTFTAAFVAASAAALIAAAFAVAASTCFCSSSLAYLAHWALYMRTVISGSISAWHEIVFIATTGRSQKSNLQTCPRLGSAMKRRRWWNA